jgi:alpha-beta hydrolase superfamily lysophospholipase
LLEEQIETILTTTDGMSIFVHAWVPGQPQRILVCIQGLGGHGGYYEDLAGQLTPEGAFVVAPDLRGHGQSKGQRGDIDSFDRYLLDIDAAVTWAMACWPNIPIFMLGESMGASLAIQYVANTVKSSQVGITLPVLAGLVLVSPVLQPTIHPTMNEVIQYIRSLLTHPSHPSLAVTGREELGCRDPIFNARLQADPLFVRLVSACFLTNLGLWLWRTRKKAHLLHLPLLVLQGGKDHIAHPRGIAAFLRRVPSKEQQSITFPQAYHCLLHDPDTPAVIKVLASWLIGSQ